MLNSFVYGSFIAVFAYASDIWNLHAQGRSLRHGWGCVAARHCHACCRLLYVWKLMHSKDLISCLLEGTNFCLGSFKALEAVDFQRIIQNILMSFTCVVLYFPQVPAKHANFVAVFFLPRLCLSDYRPLYNWIYGHPWLLTRFFCFVVGTEYRCRSQWVYLRPFSRRVYFDAPWHQGIDS